MLAAALAVSAIAPPACEIRGCAQTFPLLRGSAVLPMGDGCGNVYDEKRRFLLSGCERGTEYNGGSPLFPQF